MFQAGIGRSILLFFLPGKHSFSPGKFIKRNVKIICNPDEQINVGQSNSALVGRDRLSSDVQFQGKGVLLDLFLPAQIPYVFSDYVIYVFSHLRLLINSFNQTLMTAVIKSYFSIIRSVKYQIS